MTFEQLRTFCAVVETKSFRAAAKQLHITQPAVTLQIKALEKACGQLLLERKGCRTTPAGQLLYDRAIHILSLTESTRKELTEFDQNTPQTLRAGCSDTTALYVLPQVLREFASALPHVRLVLVNRPSETLLEMVIRGHLEIALATMPFSQKELAQIELFEERIVAVAPLRHPLSKKKVLSLRELKDTPILQLDPNTKTGKVLSEFFHRKKFTPQTVMESSSFEVIKRYVETGLGIGFLPRLALTNRDKTLTILSLQETPSVKIGVAWRKDSYQTKAQKFFIDLIAKYARIVLPTI